MKPDEVSSTALAPRPAQTLTVNWDDLRLQKLWLGIERRPWQSLSVVPASESVETYPLAELLAQLAWRYRGQPSEVVDLRDLSMRLVDYELRGIREQVAAGNRLVVALRSIYENLTTVQIAQQSDAVLLCVALGRTHFKSVDETIAAVGRQRVIGSIVLRPRPRKAKARNGR